MNRCTRCVMPDTRPDVPFQHGVCQACINYQFRTGVDQTEKWQERRHELRQLLQRHDGRCIVPSSGGKDSTYIVLKLLELGADVTVVTATTCHLTALGRANIDNLARYARTIEVTPNRAVRAKLNRLGLEMVGDISWPEHVAIFTTPFRMAAALGISLIFYGENPQNQYGGPVGSEEARTMTKRWRSEFGGFLGLRPSDMVGQKGITEQDMADYTMGNGFIDGIVEAHFLGQYLPWDSHENAQVAMGAGMRAELPSPANWWIHENLYNAQTGLHDHMMFLKYGYGRLCTQVSVDVRSGRFDRETALELVKTRDGMFPWHYAGVELWQVLERIGMTVDELKAICARFTNQALKAA